MKTNALPRIVRFHDVEQQKEGFNKLILRGGEVQHIHDTIYVITEEQCEFLSHSKIGYTRLKKKELEKLGLLRKL